MVSKFEVNGPMRVPIASTPLPTAALSATRRDFEALMGLIAAGILMIPVLYYPGLFFIVIFGELYLIDAIYARIYSARVKMSVQLEGRTSARNRTVYDCRYASKIQPQGLLTK